MPMEVIKINHINLPINIQILSFDEHKNLHINGKSINKKLNYDSSHVIKKRKQCLK